MEGRFALSPSCVLRRNQLTITDITMCIYTAKFHYTSRRFSCQCVSVELSYSTGYYMTCVHDTSPVNTLIANPT